MRYRISVAAIAVATFVAVSATAPAPALTGADRTPASCDGKPALFHVKRAKQVTRNGYDRGRYPDKTPMRGSEKRAMRKHKFCVKHDGLRERVAEHRERLSKEYRRYWKKRKSAWPRPEDVGVSSATLERIAACESGGNPRAVSVSGTYRGKYQFDRGTWAAVGGSGDPAAASEAEQDYRAALLYSRRGSQPWPVCG